jgi:hypothetical protein
MSDALIEVQPTGRDVSGLIKDLEERDDYFKEQIDIEELVVCPTNGFFVNYLPHPPGLDGKHASYAGSHCAVVQTQSTSAVHQAQRVLCWDFTTGPRQRFPTGPNPFESNKWNFVSIIAPSQNCAVHSPGTVPL